MGAAIATATALVVFWLTTFVGEDYRRARDAKALAAGLAGELESFKLGLEAAEETVRALIAQLENGGRVSKRPIPEPPESVYAANLARVGILGASIGKDLPLAYHMLYAFRVAMTVAFSADNPVEQKLVLLRALEHIGDANHVLPGLLAKLQARARQWWRPFS